MTYVLELENITKTYSQAGHYVKVIEETNLRIKPGEIIAIVGPSGSGKSTLLHIAGLLESPTHGKVKIFGTDCSNMNENKRTSIRGMNIGFIYQFHNLLSDFTALENVMMPKLINGFSRKNAKAAASSILKGIGLQNRLHHLPGTLSGGEQQRVAIARALVNKPNLILADEPTGNLDPENSKFVFNLLISAVRNLGSGCILVTHNLSLTENADRVLTFKERKLIES